MTSIDAMAVAQKAMVEGQAESIAALTKGIERQIQATKDMGASIMPAPVHRNAVPTPPAVATRAARISAVMDRIRGLPVSTPQKRAVIKRMLEDDYGMDPVEIARLPTDIPSLIAALTVAASE